MENPIRGAVFSKYPNVSSFAKAIGWHRNKASRIVKGEQSPSVKDMEEMAMCLNITDAVSFMSIFFPHAFTK